jgi:hypothetical protein
MTHHHQTPGSRPTTPGSISIGYTRADRRPGSVHDIPSMGGYRPGAAQDILTIELPAGSRLPQLPLHDLAEAVFVATNAPGAGFHDGVPGAREVASALTNPTPGTPPAVALAVGRRHRDRERPHGGVPTSRPRRMSPATNHRARSPLAARSRPTSSPP